LEAKVKKIYSESYRCPNSGGDGIGFVWELGWQSATGRIRRGEAGLFGTLDEKLLEGAEPKCPCKAVGVSASCRFQGGAASNPPFWSAD